MEPDRCGCITEDTEEGVVVVSPTETILHALDCPSARKYLLALNAMNN